MNPYQFCEGLTDTGVGAAAEDDAARGSTPYPEACTSSAHCVNQTTAANLKFLILIASLLHPSLCEIRSKRAVSAKSRRPALQSKGHGSSRRCGQLSQSVYNCAQQCAADVAM